MKLEEEDDRASATMQTRINMLGTHIMKHKTPAAKARSNQILAA